MITRLFYFIKEKYARYIREMSADVVSGKPIDANLQPNSVADSQVIYFLISFLSGKNTGSFNKMN
jgi:hypothetical protein